MQTFNIPNGYIMWQFQLVPGKTDKGLLISKWLFFKHFGNLQTLLTAKYFEIFSPVLQQKQGIHTSITAKHKLYIAETFQDQLYFQGLQSFLSTPPFIFRQYVRFLFFFLYPNCSPQHRDYQVTSEKLQLKAVKHWINITHRKILKTELITNMSASFCNK